MNTQEQNLVIQELTKNLGTLRKLKKADNQEFTTLSKSIIDTFKTLLEGTFPKLEDQELEANFSQSLNRTKAFSIFSSVAQLITSSDFKDTDEVHEILKLLLDCYSHLDFKIQSELYHSLCTHIRESFIQGEGDKKTLIHQKYTFISRKNSDLLSDKSTEMLKTAKKQRKKAEWLYLDYKPTVQNLENELNNARIALEDKEYSQDAYDLLEARCEDAKYTANKLHQDYLDADGRVKLSRERKMEIVMLPLEIVKAMNPVQRQQKIKQDYEETVVRVRKLFDDQQALVDEAAKPVIAIEELIAGYRNDRITAIKKGKRDDYAQAKRNENAALDELVTAKINLAEKQQKLSIVRESVDRIQLIKDSKKNIELRERDEAKLKEFNAQLAIDLQGKTPSIALAQISCPVGSIEATTDQIIKEIKAAYDRGVKTIMFGELAITGYLPEDLLFRDDFIEKSDQALQRIKAVVDELNLKDKSKSITVHVGHPARDQGMERKDARYAEKIFNAYSVLSPEGHFKHYKNFLAVDSVFDDARYFDVHQNTEHLNNTDFVPAFVLANKKDNEKAKERLLELGREFHDSNRRIPTLTLHEGRIVWNRICEEVWHETDPLELEYIQLAGAEAVFVINGSPYAEDKFESRYRVIGDRVRETRLPHVYMNLGGGHVNLCYGGGSFVANAVADKYGDIHPEFKQVAPHLRDGVFDVVMEKTDNGLKFIGKNLYNPLMGKAYTAYRNFQSLVKSMADHFSKTPMKHAILGLSGGADSSLVTVIAKEAMKKNNLGQSNVTAIAMPSLFTDPISNVDAALECDLLDVKFKLVAVDEIDDSFKHTIKPFAQELDQQYKEDAPKLGVIAAEAAVKEYRQKNTALIPLENKEAEDKVYQEAYEARIKMYLDWRAGAKKMAKENMGAVIRQHNILHYFSSHMSAGNMATSNKAEVVTGYYTYKDMWGALALIGDVSKEGVYAMLAENQQYIPLQVIVREPSAELKKGQKDQDSLPPYPVIDKIIRLYFDQRLSPIDIVMYMSHAWELRDKYQCDLTMVNKVIRQSQVQRFKQIVGTNISAMSATSQDSGSRMPVTNGFNNMVSLQKLENKIDTIMMASLQKLDNKIDTIITAFENEPLDLDNPLMGKIVDELQSEVEALGLLPKPTPVELETVLEVDEVDLEMQMLRADFIDAKKALDKVEKSQLTKMQEYPNGDAIRKEYSKFEYYFTQYFERIFAKVENTFRKENSGMAVEELNTEVQKMRQSFLMDCLKGKKPAALREPQRTIYYGLSANPPTNAHVEIVKYLAQANPDAKIIVAPVYDHVFDKPDLEAYSKRCKMSRQAFEGLAEPGRIQVSEIDQRSCVRAGEKVGTFAVLNNLIYEEKLTEKNRPELVLGADTFVDFLSGKWRNADEILDQCAAIHVFDRAGTPVLTPFEIVAAAFKELMLNKDTYLAADKAKNTDVFNTRLDRLTKIQAKLQGGTKYATFLHYNDVIKDDNILKCSSTLARESLANTQLFCPAAIYNYIRDKNLYAKVRARFADTQKEIADSTINTISDAVNTGNPLLAITVASAAKEALTATSMKVLNEVKTTLKSVQTTISHLRELRKNNSNSDLNELVKVNPAVEVVNKDNSNVNNNNNNNNNSDSNSNNKNVSFKGATTAILAANKWKAVALKK